MMKTLTTLLFALSSVVAVNASADALYADPAIADVFPVQAVTIQTQSVTHVADTGQLVWSAAYEEYVNPADFNASYQQTTTLASALETLDNNPPAAGRTSHSTFVWDTTAGEYQLQ